MIVVGELDGTSTIDGGTGNDTLDVDTSTSGGFSVIFNTTNGGVLDATNTAASGIFSNIEDVWGSSANDTIDAQADTDGTAILAQAGDDALYGGSGADSFDGMDGNDTVRGGQGDDTLLGGDGQNQLYGDAGDDLLVGEATDVNSLTILDGGEGADTLDGTLGNWDIASYYNDILGAINVNLNDALAESGGAAQGDVLSGIEQIDGTNLFDDTIAADGSGMEIKGWGGNDSLTGGSGNDTMFGGDGADYLFGNSGDDTLDGDDGSAAGGADTILGGFGNDQIIGDVGNDVLDGGGGDDTIFAGDDSDTIWGQGGADQIYGQNDADLINIQNNFGNDTIIGGEGVTSGTDNDTIDFGSVSTSGINIGLSANEAGTAVGGADMITFSEIESFALTDQADVFDGLFSSASTTVDGGDGDDTIDGTTAGDSLLGGAGDDQVFGGSGNDTLDGGAGADLMDGGAGDDALGYATGGDTLLGGEGNDSLRGGFTAGVDDAVLDGGGGNDSLVTYGANDTLYGGAGSDTLNADSGSEYLDGGSGNDVIYGKTGNDTILGGTGADLLEGDGDSDLFVMQDGFGNDTVTGGEGGTDFDVIDLSAVTTGVAVDWTGPEAGTIVSGTDTITFSGIEQIIFTDNADTVNASAETFAINIDGAGGDDRLLDGLGNDTIYGGAGNDRATLQSAGGDDLIIDVETVYLAGDIGDDTVSMTSGVGYVGIDENWNLSFSDGQNASSSDGTYSLTLNNVYNFDAYGATNLLDASNAGQWIQYNTWSGDHTVTGSDFNDTLISYNAAATVTFFGGAGADYLEGNGGNDTLDGGTGDDYIFGGDGNDRLTGGAGNDTLEGGTGADTYLFDDGWGSDTVTDATFSTLRFGDVTTGITFTATGADAFSATDGANTVSGTTGTFSSIYLSQGNDLVDLSGMTANTIHYVYGDYSAAADSDTIIGSDLAEQIYVLGDNGTYFAQLGGGNDYIEATDQNDSLYGEDGNDTLRGFGGNDYLDGGAGDDQFFNTDGNNTVIGGAGNDYIWDDNGTNQIYGGIGNDTIEADEGDDTIFVEDAFGTDVITGGEISETTGDVLDFSNMTGGISVTYTGSEAGTATDGVDTLSFSEIERITLTAHGDRVDTSALTGAVSFDGGGGDDTIIGGSGTGMLSGGAGNDVLIGETAAENTLTSGLSGTLTGTNGNTDIGYTVTSTATVTLSNTSDPHTYRIGEGSGVAETQTHSFDQEVNGGWLTFGLHANATATIYIDGVQADLGAMLASGELVTDRPDLINGSGQLVGQSINTAYDTFYFNTSFTTFAIEAVSPSKWAQNYQLAVDTNPVGTSYDGAADTIDGGDGDDILAGGYGNDLMSGGNDADTFMVYDQFGNDTITGGEGVSTGVDFDTLDLSGITSPSTFLGWAGMGIEVTLTGDEAGTVDSDHGTVSFSEIEAYTLTVKADRLDGRLDTAGMTVDGGASQDTIWSGAGNDLINGGDDGDRIFVSAGNDTVYGGEGGVSNDTLYLDEATAGVSVILNGFEQGTATFGGNLTEFYEIEWFYTSSPVLDNRSDFFDAQLAGNYLSYIDYGGGSDTVYGSDFDDSLDWFSYNTASTNAGNLLVSLGLGDDYVGVEGGDGSFDLGDGADYMYIMTSTGLSTIDAGAGNDSIYAYDAQVIVSGGEGADRIETGDDADVILLEDNFGADTIQGGETVTTGIDRDRVDAGLMTTGIAVVHSTAEAGTIASGADTASFSEIEEIGLTQHADSVDATALATGVSYDGLGGNDTLTGGTGGDTLSGGDGDDSIFGGAGNDFLKTGQGQDTLDGGDGNDTLMNSAGDDSLVGGAGDDLLVASAGNDTLEGGAGNDTLYGGTGNDSLDGGADNDLLVADMAGVSFNATGTDGLGEVSGMADFPTTQITYEITFSSLQDASSDLIPLANYMSGAGTNDFVIQANGGVIQIDIDFVGPLNTTIDATTLFDGTVKTLAVSWDSVTGALEVYVDGVSAFSTTYATGADINPGGTFVLGQEQDVIGGGFNPAQTFSGEIYGVRLYDDVRTPAEVLDSAEGPIADISDPNLVANWVADPDSGSFTDLTGSHAMTMSGDVAATWSSGDDVLRGGTGNDTMYGGGGQDSVVVEDGFGTDVVVGGEEGVDFDTLDFSAVTSGVSLQITSAEAGTVVQGADTINFSEVEFIRLTDAADSISRSVYYYVGYNIDAGGGDDTLNLDFGDDSILAGDGNDVVYFRNGNDTIYGGAGDDVLRGAPGATYAASTVLAYGENGNDTIWGNDGDDSLDGGADNDDIYGANGNDTIVGGTGVDTLDGGRGDDLIDGGTDGQADRFMLWDGHGADTITDGDNLGILDGVWSSSAVDVTFTGDYTGTWQTLGDLAGYSGIAQIYATAQNDTVDAGASGADLVIDGRDGADVLTGGTGNDTLEGGAGDDIINGQDGNDLMTGGDDADTFLISDGDGTDTITGGEGVTTGVDLDRIDLSAVTTAVTVTYAGDEAGTATYGVNSVAFSEIEQLTLTDQNDQVNGGADNAGMDVSAGGGDDTLSGGGGGDYLRGEDGADSISGNDGNDTLEGGAGADTINGGGLSDVIDGGAGDDSLEGFTGSDTITGGSGNDSIEGGSGDDSVQGGLGTDTINGGSGRDTLEGGEGGDTILGGGDNDLITGDDDNLYQVAAFQMGVDFTLNSGTFEGGANDITLSVASTGTATFIDSDGVIGGDTPDETFTDAGQLVIINGVSYQVLQDDTAQFSNDVTGDIYTFAILDVDLDGSGESSQAGEDGTFLIQIGGPAVPDGANLTAVNGTTNGNPADYDLTGTKIGGDDSLDGGSGNDTIDGGLGNDTIAGGTGNDSLTGGGDADTFVVQDGFGSDTVTGGETTSTGIDADTIDLSAVTTNLTVTFTGPEAGTITDGFNTITFTEIERLILGDGADTVDATGSPIGVDIVMSGGNDSFTGSVGDDSVTGDLGDDTLSGGTGNDTLQGGNGADSLIGDEGADSLDGGNQNDTIDGGIGADVLSGGDGEDSLLGGADNDTITGGNGFDLVDGGQGADSIDGGDGNDTITLSDGFGNDTISGGTGDTDTADQLNANALLGPVAVTYTGDESGTLTDGTDTVSFAEIEQISTTDFNDAIDATVNTAGATVFSQAGDDTILGGSGNDSIEYGDGNNSVVAGDGDDYVDDEAGNPGYTGANFVDLGTGNDTAFTGYGDDTVLGGDGNDVINVQLGNDSVDGGIGDDSITNEDGASTLLGGGGNDTIVGGTGGETIDGGAGNDSLSGGADADTFLLDNGYGDDTIVGGELGNDTDVLDLSATTWDQTFTLTAADGESGTVSDGFDTVSFSEIEEIALGSGNDTLILADGGGAFTVSGFEPPLGDGNEGHIGQDVLDVSGLTSDGGTTPVSVSDVTVTDDGSGNAVLTFPGGESITLLGVAPAQVNDPTQLIAMGIPADASDFIVSGDAGDNLIDGSYTGDSELDMIDNLDGVGGTNNDSVQAGDGADTVLAGLGDDTIDGGSGNDSLSGGADNDSVLGGIGDDWVSGNSGNDTVDGGDGADSVFGAEGDDSLRGGAGNDSMEGWIGNDTLDGGADNDYLDGADGNDLLFGGTGNDQLLGGNNGGQDTLYGEAGDDTLSAGDGDDALYGGIGADLQLGAGGDDTFFVENDFGQDTIQGGETGEGSGDVLEMGGADNAVTLDFTAVNAADPKSGTFTDGVATATFTEIERFELTQGDDTVIAGTSGANVRTDLGNDLATGGIGNDSFFGEAGNDTLIGGDGDDILSGNADNDSLDGGLGNDTLDGGSGDDILLGGAGADSLTGFGGADTLTGGAGADTLDGGAGNDVFNVGSGDLATGGDGDDVFNAGPGDMTGAALTIVGGEGAETGGDTLNVTGPATINMTGAESGTVTWLDGSVLTFSEIENVNYTACFTADTRIKTARGEIRAIDVRQGDMVLTRDNGYQPVRWAGSTHLSAKKLQASPDLRPVRIAQGALDGVNPERPLLVSPQHRILFETVQAELLFGEGEVLAAAVHFVTHPGVRQEIPRQGVTYVHFMFDRHELVMSDGAWTESFQPGDHTMAGLDEAQRQEIFTLFPELQQDGFETYPAARMALKRYQAEVLAKSL